MAVNWDEVQKALVPIKDYEDLSQRLKASFGYPFVINVFNYSMPELVDYTHSILGGDSRGRYTEYSSKLIGVFSELHHAGVERILDLKACVETRPGFEGFTQQSGIDALSVIMVLKYLIYWFIPAEKYLSGLVRDDPEALEAIKVLSGLAIRTNLQLLQQGISAVGRRSLAEASGLSGKTVLGIGEPSRFLAHALGE
jgi:hypothetical protein